MSTDLSGRRILITGASSGIGRAAAIAVCEAGGNVFLLGRNVERLNETAKLCNEIRLNNDLNNDLSNRLSESCEIVPVVYDLTNDPDDIPKLFQRLS
ncbi:MAG: SDR family NAD(P)-dependent oxidoreductase, partial [Planctomycetaceae bacterium]|nr:SDR family NAD(P)-dependent oxidoreductase [Planctomycetaceae bacterium]